MQCLLKGSEKYCETGRGICCQSCMEYGTCEKACLNDPRHCGYAGEKACGLCPSGTETMGRRRHSCQVNVSQPTS